MDPRQAIRRRKDEHLDLALAQSQPAGRGAFDGFQFEHCALPEIDLAEVDLHVDFLGRRLGLPFLISSMTGGPARGERINENLALAAEALQIPFAVGSQRVALEGESASGLGAALRRHAPTTPLWSNLGAAQLVTGYGADEARRAIDMIQADALVIHLNPLQEALQPGGDRRWRGVLGAIEALARAVPVPLVAKEVGFGVSGPVARRLAEAGVAAVDVAGRGGTSWASIEAARCETPGERAVAEAFADWGLPTPQALVEVRAACPELPLIGSGGVANGVDAAKAIRLGAALAGQAGPVLKAALTSPEAVLEHFDVMAQQLRIACFCTGSRDLGELRRARLVRTADANPLHDL